MALGAQAEAAKHLGATAVRAVKLRCARSEAIVGGPRLLGGVKIQEAGPCYDRRTIKDAHARLRKR